MAAVAAVVGLFVVASRSDEGTSSVVNRPPVAEGATGGQSVARSATTHVLAALEVELHGTHTTIAELRIKP